MKKTNRMKNIYFSWGLVILLVIALALPRAQAQIAVDSLVVEPETAYPGDEVSLHLSLENVGSDDIENIVVALDLTKVPFAPVGSSTEKVIDKIRDHSHESVYFDLKVLSDANAVVYKIPLTITEGTVSKTSLIAVTVSAHTHLDLLEDNSVVLTIGQQGKVSLKFVNNGQEKISFLKVTVENSPLYEILSPSSVYIGDIDLGDFETEEFTVLPLVKDPIISVEVDYRDADGKEYREPKLIQLPTYTQEEAVQKGLIAPKGTSPLLIVVVVGGIVAVVILLRRWRKKKR